MTEEIDTTDDWMNPQTRSYELSATPEQDPRKVKYLIERARSVTVFGPSGAMTEWRTWSTHDSAKERDEELKRLLKQHPVWHLRKRDSRPYWEQRGIFPPASHPGLNP